VALREAVPVPRFRHPRRPHLCNERCTPCYMSETRFMLQKNSGTS
jgi:hypothetical protein